MMIKITIPITLSFLFLLNTLKIDAQNDEKPPPPLMASDEKTKLIDEIITISGLKEYYVKYCKDVIDAEATNKKWAASKVKDKKSKAKFADFDFIAHNSYASLSIQNLKEIITLLKKVNTNSNDYFFWGLHDH